MNQKNKKYRLKQRQSKNVLIVSLMRETGWTRERVVDALEDHEEEMAGSQQEDLELYMLLIALVITFIAYPMVNLIFEYF